MLVFSRTVPGAGEDRYIQANVHKGGVVFSEYTTNSQYGGSATSSYTFAQVLAGGVPHDVPADMLLEVQAAVRAMPANDGPNAWHPDGYTLLMRAADQGDRAEVERLLATGAQLEDTGMRSDTPLQLAARRAHFDIVRMLLAAGASASSVRLDEVFNSWTKYGELVRLLLAAGVRVSAADVYQASVCGDRDSLRILLDARPELRATLQALLAAVKSIGEANDAAARAKVRDAWGRSPNDLAVLLPYQADELSTGTFEAARCREYVDEIEKLIG